MKTPIPLIVRQICWALGCTLTLGYATKYLRRVHNWQIMDFHHDDRMPKFPSPTAQDHHQPQKAKQQREMDRLNVVLSVITAASASALAIPNPFKAPGSFWVSTACFSAALGLSLEGLILITYLTVFASSGGTARLGQLSNGNRFPSKMLGPVAFILALPVMFTTYASFFLLTGLLSTVFANGRNDGVQSHIQTFKATVLIPVLTALLGVILSITTCEFSLPKKPQETKRDSTVLEEEKAPFATSK